MIILSGAYPDSGPLPHRNVVVGPILHARMRPTEPLLQEVDLERDLEGMGRCPRSPFGQWRVKGGSSITHGMICSVCSLYSGGYRLPPLPSMAYLLD